MAKETKPKIVSKKHLARLERERLQRRYILWGTVLVIAIAVGSFLFYVVNESLIKPNQPVAVVNGDKITTGEFAAQVRYYRQNMVARYEQGYQVYQMFAQSDPSTAQYFTSQLEQYSTQLADSQGLAQQVLDAMVEDEIVRQEAQRQGITVSDQEVKEYIQSNFGFYPNGTPTAAPTDLPTAIPPTLSATQLALVTATPTITPTATATATLVPTTTVEPTATFTPTPEITATQQLTPTATPTPYTEDLFNKDYQTYLDNVKTGANVNQKQVEDTVRVQLMREKLIKKMFGDLPHTEDQVWVREIVANDQAGAQAAYDRVNGGEDFAAVAAEVSSDPSGKKGGDMGWQTRDTLPSAVADAAFGMEISQISQPIETPNGWVVIQLIDKQTRQLSQTEYDNLQQTKFTDWVAQQRTDLESAGKLTINDAQWQANIPTRPSIPAGMELPTAQPQQ